MTVISFQPDAQGRNTYAPETADIKYNAALTANNETNITVPSTHAKYVAAFAYKPGAVVWVDITGATATLPASNLLTACTAELNPGQRVVRAGDTISMITGDTTDDVGVSLYATP